MTQRTQQQNNNVQHHTTVTRRSATTVRKKTVTTNNTSRSSQQRRSNPFSSHTAQRNNSLNQYRQYIARNRNTGASNRSGNTRRNSSNNRGRVVGGNNFFSNIKNLGQKLKLGIIDFKNKNTYIGAIASLGKYINSGLNYRQGTSLGDGTCGLCSLGNIATAIKLMRAKAKGGMQGLNNMISQMRKMNLPKRLEYALIRNGRHVGGGGTTQGQQAANMRNMPKLIGGILGLKKNIFGGTAYAGTSFLDKVLAQGRLAQINIASSGLFSGRNMVGGGIDHAVSIGGMRIGADGRKQYALMDSSGFRAGRGAQWINESQLSGGRFEITYTKPLADIINA